MKNETNWLPLAESLESGQALAETESEVATLQKQIADIEAMFKSQTEDMKAVHRAQLDDLKTENTGLQALVEQANAVINRLRDEEKQRQQKPEKLSSVQERVLGVVRIGEVRKSTNDIAGEADLRVDLAESHLHILQDRDYVFPETIKRGAEWVTLWRRTSEGNSYLNAYGLLGDESVF